MKFVTSFIILTEGVTALCIIERRKVKEMRARLHILIFPSRIKFDDKRRKTKLKDDLDNPLIFFCIDNPNTSSGIRSINRICFVQLLPKMTFWVKYFVTSMDFFTIELI